MQSYKLYTVEIKKNVSNLVTVPFRNAVDLPFLLRSVPLRSVSGALPHFPRALATTVGFYEMEVLLVAAWGLCAPLIRFFTMIGPCLATAVVPRETRPFLALRGGRVERKEFFFFGIKL